MPEATLYWTQEQISQANSLLICIAEGTDMTTFDWYKHLIPQDVSTPAGITFDGWAKDTKTLSQK